MTYSQLKKTFNQKARRLINKATLAIVLTAAVGGGTVYAQHSIYEKNIIALEEEIIGWKYEMDQKDEESVIPPKKRGIQK